MALVILAIGILIVLGMIIVLRINAFIALITAAIVVSLLAPGEIASKISRVAEAFGSYAGSIGIVIALAAIIGQCMMDSGAADRIVRAFLKVLGEKQASFALMGSGFVLAVPVFFDTVFYLLVPLARSLYRKTNRNYLLYILAISAGGAITHTLVPPTPGPLIMAATLGIDIGIMIMVGAIVALPAALAGILCAKFLDARMNIPMRQVGNQPDPPPLADSELPSLFASLLPILLPVVIIATNTIVTSLADAERKGMVRAQDITDWGQFANDVNSTPVGQHLLTELKKVGVESVDANMDDSAKADVLAGLERVTRDRQFYQPQVFAGVLPPAWKVDLDLKEAAKGTDTSALDRMQAFYGLYGKLGERTKPVDIERMNRLLLETSFPGVIKAHEWNSPMRSASQWTSMFGNANFSLLLSMAVAMWVLMKQRQPTLQEMSTTVENALMSGGAIILITAAGGAFGAMLKVAQIGPAIEGLFDVGTGSGMFYLFLGFGIAALLKVAQGSSTTAMIVVSGMLAPVVAGVDLGFNTVYLATAIGAGSLVGSWMNDSGFWIFARMSGLTEAEALKSWTPLLLVLATVSMGATLLLANFLPLV
jgi:GntP family gluconate:H+ symporter